MPGFRDFSSSERLVPAVRNIDADAPIEMRQELVDVMFSICEGHQEQIDQRRIYEISSQSIGAAVAGNPYGGYRYAVGRDIAGIEWNRVYDLICRVYPEFLRVNLQDEYRDAVNRILAAYGVVWELNEHGHLGRVLPMAAQAQIESAIQELRQPRFDAAAQLFNQARDAYDDRPRRDRDACANAFDAMESVAKVVFNMPSATFGSVLGHIRSANCLTSEIVGALKGINTLRNSKFGHGLQTPFDLSPPEVDFTYLSCIGGILLFARRP